MLLTVLILVLCAVVVCALAFAFQRKLIYQPSTLPVPGAAELLPGAREASFSTSDGLRLTGWFVPASGGDGDCVPTVLVAPGNAGDRSLRIPLASALSRSGLSVLLLDYRGYGGNPGSPTEEGLARDAMAASAALDDLGYPAERTVYFGESLGSAVVVALQTQHPPAGMVLRSPFTELADVRARRHPGVPVRLLLRDRFPVVEHLSESVVPVTVVYGDRDSVVAPELSARVADEAPTLVERVVIAGADHNDAVMSGPQVAGPVARLVDKVG